VSAERRSTLSENFIDFRTIKQLVSMKAVLDRYGIALRKVNQNSLRGLCPLPTHTSDKSKESFGVQTSKNIWACQSTSCAAARAGKKGGNVLDFVSVMESFSIRDAALRLHEWFGSTASTGSASEKKPERSTDDKKLVAEKVTERKEGSEQPQENKPLTFTLKDVDGKHPYLRSRGIKEETAREFGVGFFPGKGSMSGRVVIPIHNERGELVAYAGRSIDNTEPKYKLPAGFHKSVELFNLHRLLAQDSRQDLVIIVEGFFDTLKVHQAGIRNVVGLMGSALSEHQEKLLCSFKSVVLFLDGDEVGREAAKIISGRLVHSHFVKVISLPEGKQPDRLSSEEIRTVLEWGSK
jgi:DNA primase